MYIVISRENGRENLQNYYQRQKELSQIIEKESIVKKYF